MNFKRPCTIQRSEPSMNDMDRLVQLFIGKRLWTLGVHERIRIYDDIADWSLYYSFDGLGPDPECHMLLYNERLTRLIVRSRIIGGNIDKRVSLQRAKVTSNVYQLSAIFLLDALLPVKAGDTNIVGRYYYYVCAPSIIGNIRHPPQLTMSSVMMSSSPSPQSAQFTKQANKSVKKQHRTRIHEFRHFGYTVGSVKIHNLTGHIIGTIKCENKDPDICLECTTSIKPGVHFNDKYLNMIINC